MPFPFLLARLLAAQAAGMGSGFGGGGGGGGSEASAGSDWPAFAPERARAGYLAKEISASAARVAQVRAVAQA